MNSDHKLNIDTYWNNSYSWLVAGGLLLRKARENLWKILIPFYGQYCLYRIASAEGAFGGTVVISILSSVISNIVASNIARNTFFLDRPDTTPLMIISMVTGLIILIMQGYFAGKLAASFGKGKIFAIGLLFLFPIFGMILGCGSAVYNAQSGYNTLASETGTWICPQCGTENPLFKGTCQRCGTVKQG